MNAEEALRCVEIANRYQSEGNTSGAIRFAKKAIALHPTAAAKSLLERLEKAEKAPAKGTSSSTSTRTPLTPRASTSTAPPPPPVEKREYTPAQTALVKRVRACKVSAYYEILAVEKGCDDAAVKKAYRKLALGLHPDKCGAPGAEEAFKMVSKAFQVLSDGQKRAIFDQTGADPDSRGGGGGGGGGGMASAFQRGGGMGGGVPFQGEELSPEDLFRFFFGQGGGAQFGGGGGPFRTQFYGPGGINMSAGGRRPPQRAGGAAGTESGSVWLQVLPLLLLFGFSLLTQIPSLFGTSAPADPEFSFSRGGSYNIPRTTSTMGVDYFVNAKQFSSHPIYANILESNPTLAFKSRHEKGSSPYRNDLLQHILKSVPAVKTAEPVNDAPSPSKDHSAREQRVPPSLLAFEKTVERTHVQLLQQYCQNEIQSRNQRLETARGFFGIGADWDKVKAITNEKLVACSKLRDLGYQVRMN